MASYRKDHVKEIQHPEFKKRTLPKPTTKFLDNAIRSEQQLRDEPIHLPSTHHLCSDVATPIKNIKTREQILQKITQLKKVRENRKERERGYVEAHKRNILNREVRLKQRSLKINLTKKKSVPAQKQKKAVLFKKDPRSEGPW